MEKTNLQMRSRAAANIALDIWPAGQLTILWREYYEASVLAEVTLLNSRNQLKQYIFY
jgi:hypothetical protein